VAEVILSRGQIALVDDEDLLKVSGYRWRLNKNGYVITTLSGRRTVYLHRVVLGSKPGEKTDHRHHDKLDNRQAQFRECNQLQNMDNARTQTRPKSSVFKGVCWHTQRSKWLACTKQTVNGKKRSVYLGVFTDEVSAARACNAAALEYFGPEFALLNPV
jgi:hypothetical protein